MKTVSTVLLLVVLAFSFGCKKKDEPKPKTPQELILGKWTFASALDRGIEEIKDCQKDNTFEFKPNGTVALKPGIVMCPSSGDNIDEDNVLYSVSQDGKTLTVSYPTVTINEIIELSEKTLRLSLDGRIYTLRK